MKPRKPSRKPGIVRLFGPPNTSGHLSLSTVKQRAARILGRFSRYARKELDKQKISLPPALNLIHHPQYGLTLGTGHPQHEKILVWITGNAKLAKRFKEVEVLFEVIRALEHPGVTLADEICFHIGLTSAGPIAYFAVNTYTPTNNIA